MKTGAHPQTDWKTKSPRKILARAFKWGCSFIFSARRGRLRRRGGVLRIRGEFHHGGICAIRLCAACASNTHNENRGHNTGEAGFARHFRFSSMAKYSFRKKMLAPRLARDCDYARAMECGSCASRAHMRRPEGFPRRRLRYLRDSGLGNALQINPSPLQRSYNTLAKPAICSGKTLFPPNGRVGHPYRTLGAMRSVAGKTARSEKIRLSAQNEMRVAAARIRAFGLSANPEIPRGGRAGFCGARAGAGDGLASEQVVVRPPASAVF